MKILENVNIGKGEIGVKNRKKTYYQWTHYYSSLQNGEKQNSCDKHFSLKTILKEQFSSKRFLVCLIK